MDMNELTDPVEARDVLDGFIEELKRRGWDELWAAYAEEHVTRLGRRKVSGRSEERYDEVVAPSGRRYGIWSFGSADDASRLQILITLHEDDAAYKTLGDSLIVRPGDVVG